METKLEKFYISLKIRDGQTVGHGFSSTAQKFDFKNTEPNRQKDEPPKTTPIGSSDSFETVFDGFVSSIEAYRRFMPFTLGLAPEIAKVVAEREITRYARDNGTKRDDLSSADSEVYELETKFLREFSARSETVRSATEGAHLLPEVMIVGLVSAYDGFLASLLKVIINKQPELVLTSQKQITFKELLDFQSIDDARSTLIEREIESVIRLSHHEQFDWMQKHLNVKLKEGLDVWPRFVELCERRNLFTHTAGIVSTQYMKNCTEHKCDISNVTAGQRLSVGSAYFKGGVEAVYEIGLKLCYVFWRKFSEAESDKADSEFNRRCMELIAARAYKLAEALLKFSHKVPRIGDQVRRMMIVNLANAIRLQDRGEEAIKLLEMEDWSATKDQFKLCVASVKGNIEEVLELMDQIGKREEPHNYRTWPVFKITRDDRRFVEKFESIYGEPFLLVADSGDTTHNDDDTPQGQTARESADDPGNPSTVH